MIYDYDDVYILEDNEEPNPLYGMETHTFTPNVIACLQAGKRIYIPVNDEYAVVLKLDDLSPSQSERMTNRQWVDFLSKQFDISRTSAKEMLHGMMRWKAEDNFKKQFSGEGVERVTGC